MECVRTRELVMVVGVPFDNLDLDEAAERGLEWLHRMALEPRRLGRRYLSDFFSFTYFSYRQRYHQAWRNLFSPRGVAGEHRRPRPCARLVSMALSGRLDYRSAPGLRRTAEGELRRGSGLLLDLSALEFIDSSGLGVLAGLEKLARELDASLHLAAPGEKILATMRQARLDSFLTLVRDEADACSMANDPASHPLLSIEAPRNGSLTVSLAGRIDAAVSRQIEDSLRQLARDRTFERLVLDMRGVSFIDSSGVGVLLALDEYLRSREAVLTLRNLNGSPARAFKLLGLDRLPGLEPH